MDRRFKWTNLSLAIVATFFAGQNALAQCDSGGCDSGAYSVAVAQPVYAGGGGCASGRCGSGCNFGYPGSSGCSGGACGGHFGGGLRNHNGPIKQHAHHLAEIHKRDFARNQAWPKPFQCADRQLYVSMWDAMLDNGYRWNCVFTAEHFDKDSNQLNNSGQAKIQGIFRNNPMAQKVALVQNDGNSSVVDSRLANLQSTIDKWYGSGSFMEVALTDQFPGRHAGFRAQTINFQYQEGTPPPSIPIPSGTGSTSDVGVGD